MADEVVIGTSYTPASNMQYIRAYDLWIKDINAAGGLLGRPVRLLSYDDHKDTAQCADNYRRLIEQDKVDLLLGPCHSYMVEPVAEVTEKANMLLLEGSGSVGEMFRQGRKWLFCCWGVDRDYMKSYLDYMTGPSSPHPIKKLAVVCGARPRGAGHAYGVRYHAARLGLEIVFEERVGDPPVDYVAVLRRAHATGPDVLLWDLEARADAGRTAVAAAVDAGFAPSQIWLSDNPSQRGKELSGMFSRVTWLPNDPNPSSRQFVAGYREAFDVVPEYHSAGGYTCGQVLHQAINATGTLDNATLRDAVSRMTFDTVLGPIRFDEDGLPITTFPVAQWQGDTPELVYPDRVKTRDATFD